MARHSKVWELREDMRPLLKKVKKLFPTMLGHVRTHRILLCSFMSKTSAHLAKIHTNRYPWCIALPQYDYVIQFHSSRFDNERTSFKLMVMLNELYYIPEGGFDKDDRKHYRKLRKHNTQDFTSMLQAYGLRHEKVKKIYAGERYFLRKVEKK